MVLVHITSLTQFKDFLFFAEPKSQGSSDPGQKDTRPKHRYVFVDFFATWCGPCKRITPLIEQLSEKYPQIAFLKVDVDEVPELAEKYEVQSLPTFAVFAIGNMKPIRLIAGSDPTLIAKTVEMVAVGAYDDTQKDK